MLYPDYPVSTLLYMELVIYVIILSIYLLQQLNY